MLCARAGVGVAAMGRVVVYLQRCFTNMYRDGSLVPGNSEINVCVRFRDFREKRGSPITLSRVVVHEMKQLSKGSNILTFNVLTNGG